MSKGLGVSNNAVIVIDDNKSTSDSLQMFLEFEEFVVKVGADAFVRKDKLGHELLPLIKNECKFKYHHK